MIEAEMSITSSAMDNRRHQGDEMLLVKFFRKGQPDAAATLRESRPMFKETDYISIMQPGNKDSIVIRPATPMDKDRFAQHWVKYQARENQDYGTGTPLEEWGGLSISQLNELKYMNVGTVEQLVGISDVNGQGMMGIHQLKQRAQRFLEGNDADKLAAENKKKDDLLASMQKRLDELEKTASKKTRRKPVAETTEE